MVTQAEIKSAIRPALEKYPEWRFTHGSLFCMPVGFYLRGVAFNGSWSDRKVVRIVRYVFPLFESLQGEHLSWGRGYPIPDTPNHRWNLFHPQFAEKLIEVMEQEIIPTTAHIQTGADFLHYLNTNYTSSGWPDWGKAQAYIHMGELDTARDLLIPLAKTIRTRFPQLQEPGSWGHNLLELLRLIEEDRDAIPAHCEAVAHKSVAACKLEKFWQPTPFVYDARRSKP
jgi:hypothetical protein